MEESYTVKVEEATPAVDGMPSAGPVYRSIYAKEGLMELPSAMESPWEFFSGSVKRYPHNPMVGRRQMVDGKVGQYQWQTYQETYNKVLQMATAMRNRGVNPGDRCGIFGSNCPEWIIAMEACNSHGICYVPLYDTLGAHAVEFIIIHAEVSIAFVQENKIPAVLTCLPRTCSHLKTIVSFGSITSVQKDEAEKLGVSCVSWDEFASSTEGNCKIPVKKRTDICTIMYTSGTTGDPKGVVLTNEAVIAAVNAMDLLLLETDRAVTEEDCYFSFLPLAHIFDQVMENYCISKGASVGFWQGDVRYLMEDLHVLKPTMFCGVPRVYDRIHSGIISKLSAGSFLSKKLFQFAYNYKLSNLKRGLRQDEAAPFFDKLIFSKIKQAFGGRVRILISGAAPLPKHLEEFLRVTSCSILSQGYGLTESCAGCFTSIANVYPMIGTVGVPIPTVEARLESVPDMGYDALSSAPRGEICLRGKTLFSGYHKRPDLTSETIVDGWFHTGDIGEWQPNGAMKIIDRKKNIFKLSQGEYIAVESIENIYSRCPLIASIWIYGNSFESFIVAVVVPERRSLEDWAATNGISGDFQFLCQNPRIRSHILDELNKIGHANEEISIANRISLLS